MRNKLVIILLGAPGAGKGTQAELLSEKLNLYYFETSNVIEQAFNSAKETDYVSIKGKKYFFGKEKELWLGGALCDPLFVSYLVKGKIKELYGMGKNLLLSGSPRTLGEAKEIMPLLEKLYGKKNIKIILLEISAKESIFRNSHRRICELMRHPILYSEETKKLKICPLDGSKLIKRKGLDNPKIIKTRLKEYSKRTLPLVDFLKTRGLKVEKINGKGTVAQVFKRALKVLK